MNPFTERTTPQIPNRTIKTTIPLFWRDQLLSLSTVTAVNFHRDVIVTAAARRQITALFLNSLLEVLSQFLFLADTDSAEIWQLVGFGS